MKRLLALLLITPTLLAQGIGGKAGIGGKEGMGGGATVSCNSPTGLTYQWAAYSLTGTNNCGSAGTTLCANGGTVYTLPESIASNNAVQATSGNQPIFLTNQINGLPAIQGNGSVTSGSEEFLVLTTSIPATNNVTIYAVVNSADTGTGNNYSIISGTSNIVSSLNYRFKYNTGANNVQWLKIDNNNGGGGTATFNSSTWYTVAETYNESSGAYQLYTCSGGTCTADGAGGTLDGNPPTAPLTNLMGGGSDYTWGGSIAEWGYLNGTSLPSGLGAYSQCKYGI